MVVDNQAWEASAGTTSRRASPMKGKMQWRPYSEVIQEPLPLKLRSPRVAIWEIVWLKRCDFACAFGRPPSLGHFAFMFLQQHPDFTTQNCPQHCWEDRILLK